MGKGRPVSSSAASLTDLEGFDRELRALKAEATAALGPDDLAHLLKLERWGRACTFAGYATSWLVPNPLSMALIATGAMSRWAIIAHHVTHKGMDRVPGTPARLTSSGFAKGARRWVDWFDWFIPEAWSYEHNVLHHAYTNEVVDPDLVEENLAPLRDAKLPQLLKVLVVLTSAATWKVTYYAPNTLQVLQRKRRREGQRELTARSDARGPERTIAAFDFTQRDGRELWLRSLLPYTLLRFVLLPACALPLGSFAALSVWLNSLGAELLANLYTFFIITPNHAGDDLERFDGPTAQPREWFVRQVRSSVNYRTGGDLNDFLHGFLNYQIEHHLFPELPPRQYQLLQPRVKALCEKYGVPYRQQSVFARVRQLVGIAIGERRMARPTPAVTAPALVP
jgi:fatty acid desaturase